MYKIAGRGSITMKMIRGIYGILLCCVLMCSMCFAAAEEHTDAAALAKKYGLIDLHLHLDGSLSPDSVRELATMQGIAIPEDDDELLSLLQVDEDCRDLNEYLEKFDFTVSLLQTKEALSTSVYNLERQLEELGMLYAEIRFAPQLHTQKGLTQAEIVEAVIEGMNRCDFRSSLILCCMRGDNNHEENIETVYVAKEYLGKGVSALDIAGAEALFPTADFEDLFLLAAELGIPYTIHAGEADGPSSVYEALRFGAKRIGHGVRAAEDEALMRRLAEEGVTLEICPTSNLNTAIFEKMEDSPLLPMLEKGIRVTINSDNMVVSATDVQQELMKVIEAFSLTEEQLWQLAQNAVDASYADSETKDWLTAELAKRISD
ncbi:MAG: adenosine deaminase [Eubacteriales bacterium]|nr:adenosine deaminase [Eubacteriales bacterium]